jgi:hypothetical protein
MLRVSFMKKHLLIDLPSVDKEKTMEKLAHKSLWNVTDVNNLNADAMTVRSLRR